VRRVEIGVRSGVGAGGGLGCGPLEGLRNMGRRRRAKGMRKAHIVVGSHGANNDNINRQTRARPDLISYHDTHHLIHSQNSI
jgi:hypothetical protein